MSASTAPCTVLVLYLPQRCQRCEEVVLDIRRLEHRGTGLRWTSQLRCGCWGGGPPLLPQDEKRYLDPL